MKITDVNIPKDELLDVGLNDIATNRLDRLVFIAGPNGAGKTRLLRKISILFRDYLTSNQRMNLEKEIGEIEASLSRYKKTLHKLKEFAADS